MSARDDTPSIREIAALTARLRELSGAGRDADPAERAAFLADKDALLARIDDPRTAGSARSAAGQTNVADVLARADAGAYAMVGPSARTWSVDPPTGLPLGPVPEAEHRLVRDLIAQERLDSAQPAWLPCDDGGEEIVTAIVPVDDDGWFTEGYDDAHTTYLDQLGHAHALPVDEADTDEAERVGSTAGEVAERRPGAAVAVAEARDAVSSLTDFVADRTGSASAAPTTDRGREPSDAAVEDDEPGWSR